MAFESHGKVERLVGDLAPTVHVVNRLRTVGAMGLVEFEVRRPSCRKHQDEHAREGGIEHAIANGKALGDSLEPAATISLKRSEKEGHLDIDYRFDHPLFEHTRWGTLCAESAAMPKQKAAIRKVIANDVVMTYLAELSADSYAAKLAGAPLGLSLIHISRRRYRDSGPLAPGTRASERRCRALWRTPILPRS